MKKLVFSFLFLMVPVLVLSAQNSQRVVSGTVTTADTGEPAVGATVLVKGTQTAAVVSGNGSYSIRVRPDTNPELEFSYMGYETVTVKVGDKSHIDVNLQVDRSNVLDEVVMIGYGSAIRHQDLTGSVASVSAKDIVNTPLASVTEALQGRMAGVMVTTADGDVDQNISVLVRGGTSLTQSNEPLYVVDGVQVPDINNLSPSDIKSIDVLKDASSTAIYGAQGANGVVVVTTKSAMEGHTRVSINAYLQLGVIANLMKVLDAKEFAMWEYEKDVITKNTGNFTGFFGNPEDIPLYAKYGQGDDWQQKYYGRPALTQYYNGSITGGTKAASYNVSLTHTNRDGIQIGTNYKRTNVNGRLNFRMSPRITGLLDVRYSDTKNGGVSYGPIRMLRYTPIKGTAEYSAADIANPMYEPEILNEEELEESLEYQYQKERSRDTKDLLGRLVLKYTFPFGLNISTDIKTTTGNMETKSFDGPYTSNSIKNYGGTPSVGINTRRNNRIAWTNTAQWKFKARKSKFDVLLGQELLMNNTYTTNFVTYKFPKDISSEKAYANLTLGEPIYSESSQTGWIRTLSFFTRANYSYLDKYIFTVTMRADGSNLFAKGHQWGFFPAGAFAWRISQEPWMKGLRNVSELKLRLSYGTVGNNRIGDELYRKAYIVKNNYMSPSFAGDVQNYYVSKSDYLTNPDLKWETTVTRNAGLDFGLFRNRLTGTFEVYWNTTKDLLVPSAIVPTTGFASLMSNVGQTSNRGVELSLNGYFVEKRNFSLSASLNLAHNRSRIDNLSSGEKYWERNSGWSSYKKELMDYKIEVGNTLGCYYGYVTDGMYTFDDFDFVDGKWELKEGVADDRNILGTTELYPGLLKLKKLSGTGTVVNPDEDRTYIGCNIPKLQGGFGVNMTIWNFDVSAFFNFMLGFDVYNINKIVMTSMGHYYRNMNLYTMMDSSHRFRYVDDSNRDLRYDPEALRALNTGDRIWSPMTWNYVVHSWAIEDGSFLRLNNLTIGYSFPTKVLQKVNISKLRLYVTGGNLFCLTNYSGYDPEVNVQNGLTPGQDYNTYPRSRMYTFGLNLDF